MSTGTDSLIRRSRKARPCARCANTIRVGDFYLSYAPGQRTRIPYCTQCARVAHPNLIAVAYMDATIAALRPGVTA